jgi:hypothetical protein
MPTQFANYIHTSIHTVHTFESYQCLHCSQTWRLRLLTLLQCQPWLCRRSGRHCRPTTNLQNVANRRLLVHLVFAKLLSLLTTPFLVEQLHIRPMLSRPAFAVPGRRVSTRAYFLEELRRQYAPAWEEGRERELAQRMTMSGALLRGVPRGLLLSMAMAQAACSTEPPTRMAMPKTMTMWTSSNCRPRAVVKQQGNRSERTLRKQFPRTLFQPHLTSSRMLIEAFTPDQAERYDMFRRVKLRKDQVRRVGGLVA